MADDKPGGDDLFEDLDKFFAPIRDVDWESDETPAASGGSQEEHVAVRPSEPDPVVIADEPDVTVSPASSTIEDEEDDEDAWYDTSVLEPIDELMGEAIEDEDIDDRPRRGRRRRCRNRSADRVRLRGSDGPGRALRCAPGCGRRIGRRRRAVAGRHRGGRRAFLRIDPCRRRTGRRTDRRGRDRRARRSLPPPREMTCSPISTAATSRTTSCRTSMRTTEPRGRWWSGPRASAVPAGRSRPRWRWAPISIVVAPAKGSGTCPPRSSPGSSWPASRSGA